MSLSDLDGWNPFKDISNIMNSVEKSVKKVTAALPITRKFDKFVDKTVINPAAALNRAVLSPMDPNSTAGRILTANMTNVVTRLTEKSIGLTSKKSQEKFYSLVDKGSTLLNKNIKTAEFNVDKIVAWELKNPGVLKVIASLVVACVCSYAFGAWASIISSTGMKLATQPPDPVPEVPGSSTVGDLGLGSVGPEVSRILKQYADAMGIPTMYIPISDSEGMYVPASEEGIFGGTVSAMDWLTHAVTNKYVSPDVAIKVLDLLKVTVNGAITAGFNRVRCEELISMIDKQKTQYQAGVIPSAIGQSSGYLVWIIAGAAILLLMRGKR